jgi:hypothetical protein
VSKPTFGQQVTVKATLNKRREKSYTTWTRHECQPVTGIYIGQRTIQEGRTEYDHDYGEGGEVYTYSSFIPKKWIRVWLIVPNEHTNALRVLPEDVEFEALESAGAS